MLKMTNTNQRDFAEMYADSINDGFKVMISIFRHRFTDYDRARGEYMDKSKDCAKLFFQMYTSIDRNPQRVAKIKKELVEWLKYRAAKEY